MIGLTPAEVYDMTLADFNACCQAHNQMKKRHTEEETAQSWKIANFTGAAFAGKLKSLSHYITETPTAINAPAVSEQQQKELDRRFAENRGE